MNASRIMMAVVLVVATGAPLRAWAAPGDVYSKEDWPTELSQRPLTLAAGMFELRVPVNDNLSAGRVGSPVTINPSLYFGFNQNVTLGARTFNGLCITGSGGGGCPRALDDFALDSRWNLGRSGPFQVALGVGLDFFRVSSPTLVAGEARFEFKWGSSRAALVTAPTISFGLSNRDEAAFHTVRMATTAYGNREQVTLPVQLQLQATDKLAFFAGAAITGPLDPIVGNFTDYYTIPVNVGGLYAIGNRFDVGVAATWPQLIGGNRNTDNRYITGFAVLRL